MSQSDEKDHNAALLPADPSAAVQTETLLNAIEQAKEAVLKAGDKLTSICWTQLAEGVDALIAAVRAESATAVGTVLRRDDQPVWLLEAKSGGGVPIYWTGRSFSIQGRGAFDEDVNWAVRFARREDAEQVRGWVLDKDVRDMCAAVEHLWSTVTPVVLGSGTQAAQHDPATTRRSEAP